MQTFNQRLCKRIEGVWNVYWLDYLFKELLCENSRTTIFAFHFCKQVFHVQLVHVSCKKFHLSFLTGIKMADKHEKYEYSTVD